MQLLPAKEGTCPACAVDHKPESPHNQQSLYYQQRFYFERGRWPTWADAVAHCDDETRGLWKSALEKRGQWSEPETGEPIADHPDQTERKLVGTNPIK
ncbi:hypothetical protein [Paremcibacter congregatus]|uniref:hypothetical protein n=1 Tax=Paremcibacter congregatus TaxID=2043170 RepID=UPI003A953269